MIMCAPAYDRLTKPYIIRGLASEESIDSSHFGEAIQYRTLHRRLWV